MPNDDTNQSDSTPSRLPRREFLGNLAALGGGAVIAALAGDIGCAEHPASASAASAAGAAASPLASSASSNQSLYLETSNGWYMHNGKVVWGNGQFNHWWGGFRGDPHGWWSDEGLTPALIRNDPGQIGLNKTEDLDQLTDSMLRYGYPAFEHTPPLWYDRRRDTHELFPHTTPNVVGPFLEMPWARTTQGKACDGLPLYDLTKFNPWYFARVKEFADYCDRKGTILFFNFYNQHNLLETIAHYVDYPWRPQNCIQATGLPADVPAANSFYDVSDPLRRQLHQLYIRHCLDTLKNNRNVVFMTGFEYTGPLTFMQFYFDTIMEWEQQAGRKVHIGLGATKDVTDAILADPKYGPRVGTIYPRAWFYKPDGSLFAPQGGQQIPGRYMGGGEAMRPIQFYKLIKEYRLRYPDKAIATLYGTDQQHTMAFFMAGGSMLIRGMDYVTEYPPTYERPLGVEHVYPIYEFIRNYIGEDLSRMRPLDITDAPETTFVMGEPGESYLIYMPYGNQWFNIDLINAPGHYEAKWLGMRLGKVFTFTSSAPGEEGRRIRGYMGKWEGGKLCEVSGPDLQPWMLWLKKRTS